MLRAVEPVEAFKEEILKEFEDPTAKCIAGVCMLLGELETANPSMEERCGFLDDRYEIYAIPVPGCKQLALVVSLDTAGKPFWPCILHGLVRQNGWSCEVGKRKAMKHFNLLNCSWEPANAR